MQLGSRFATEEERQSWKEDRKEISDITHPFSGSERNRLFGNDHGEQFLDLSGVSGVDSPADGRVSVWFDYDGDSRQDLAVVNSSRPFFQLYRNATGSVGDRGRNRESDVQVSDSDDRGGDSDDRNSDSGQSRGTDSVGDGGQSFAAFRFEGGARSTTPSDELSNRDGWGTRVTIHAGDLRLSREHRCGQGFAGQGSATMLAGLGDAETIDNLKVEWPSGRVSEFRDLPTRRLIVLSEPTTAHEEPASPLDVDYQLMAERGPADRLPADQVPADPVPADRESSAASASTQKTGDSASTLTGEVALTSPEMKLDPGELAAASGAEADDADLYVLTTMASWCVACARHQPVLEQIRDTFGAEQLSVIGFAADPADPEEALNDFIERHDVSYPVIRQPEATLQSRVQAILDSGGGSDILPSTIVLNSTGRVLESFSGVPTVSGIRRLIRKHGR